MHKYSAIATFLLLLFCGCGAGDKSQIVGLMVSPASATAAVGSGADFSVALQYVDGHQKPVSKPIWSVQGYASLLFGTSADGRLTVQCVRRSDYFAAGYVGDTVMAQAAVGGQVYVGTASLVCE